MTEIKSPAFQFYYKEWITGTKGMTRTERDIYLHLLIYQFDSRNKLPSDERELLRISEARTKPEKEALKYVISKKFTESPEGYLTNRKMNDVIYQLEVYKKKQSENGKSGGRPKKAVGFSGLTENEAKESSTTTTASTTELNTNTEIQNNTLKGSKHFEHVKEFYSHPYEKQFEGFRKEHTKAEYENFQKFLNAMFRDFTIDQLTTNFDKCIGIGDWKKVIHSKGFMVIKPALEKAIAAKEGNRDQMALRIKTFTNGLLDEKVFSK